MKLQSIKAEIFRWLGIADTTALKQKRPDLAQGRDLRYKAQWLAIHSLLQDDLTLDDLAREEQELKQSLYRVARLVGTAVTSVEETWETIQQSAQTNDLDITLAELEV
jgi:hypothetical protein